jgi:2-phospho-L-lactate guanylyltransferase
VGGPARPWQDRPVVHTHPLPVWTLVLPLKGGPGAKSRLGGGPELARAIAEDCLDAVLACPVVARVVVVTADAATADSAARAGARTVPETRPGRGLVAAVRDGVTAAAADPVRVDGVPQPIGVLLGDLPALRPTDLAAGLAAAQAALMAHPEAPMAALPDAEGGGTVLLAARSAATLDPAFGPGSLAEHVRRGAVRIEIDAPRLRQDVDTRADLLVALALGVGPRTASALACARTAG